MFGFIKIIKFCLDVESYIVLIKICIFFKIKKSLVVLCLFLIMCWKISFLNGIMCVLF